RSGRVILAAICAPSRLKAAFLALSATSLSACIATSISSSRDWGLFIRGSNFKSAARASARLPLTASLAISRTSSLSAIPVPHLQPVPPHCHLVSQYLEYEEHVQG